MIQVEMKSSYRKTLERKQKKVLDLYGELSKTDIPQTQLWKEIVKRSDYTTVEGVLKVLRSNGIDIKKRTYNKKNDNE